MTIQEKTIQLIDELKSTCQLFGMGNDGNEYKVITQVFLYKFLNDKFACEIKKIAPFLQKSKNWEVEYEKLSKEEREAWIVKLSPDIAIFYPKHLISHLFQERRREDFDIYFDDVMLEVASLNERIFSTQSTQNTKLFIFERLCIHVTDITHRADFARTLVDKIHRFSFEEVFEQKYDFFATIFEYLIGDYNSAGGGKYAEYYTPHSIASIMSKLLVEEVIQDISSREEEKLQIYDPSAGTGSLLIALAHEIGAKNCRVFAQDISQKSNKMLKCNLILNDMASSLKNAVQGDTLISPYHRSEDGMMLRKFDYVVSNPPFRMDFSENREKLAAMKSRFWAGVPAVPNRKKDSMAIYTLFIQHVINSLNEKGKGAIVVPTGFITAKNGIEGILLHEMIEKKIVYGCISMPSNVFANTGTNVSVLFFDNVGNHDAVILIDASKLGEEYKEAGKQKKRLREFEIEKIVQAFKDRRNVENFSAYVTFDEIQNKQYSLSAATYFEIKLEFESMTKQEFEHKTSLYTAMLQEHFEEDRRLQDEIINGLGKIRFNG